MSFLSFNLSKWKKGLCIKPPALTPQQNEVAERKNRHLKVTQALMFIIGVPKHIWGEAIHTTTNLINKIPFKVG